MKRNIYYITLLLTWALLAACTDELYREVATDGYIYSSTPITLNVSPQAVTFNDAGMHQYSQAPTVNSTDTWTASGVNTEWVKLFSPMSGNAGYTGIEIAVDPKPTPESRVNIVGFKLDRNDAFSSTLTITQTGQAYRFGIKNYTEEVRTFGAAGETKTFDIDTNMPAGNPVEVNVTSSFPIQDCVASVTPDRKLKVTLNPATGNVSRHYQIQLTTIIKGIRYTSAVVVIQKGISVTGSVSSITIPAAGGDGYCALTSNIPCGIYKDADWIEVSSTTMGVGSATLKITAAVNTSSSQRSGKVYLVRNGAEGTLYYSLHTITVTQEGAEVTGGTSMIFPSVGASLTDVINTNIPCSVVADASWLSVSPATCRPGRNTITVTATTNPYLEDRSSTISVYPASGDRTLLHRLTVTQRAISGGATENVFAGLSARGDKVTVDFTCDAAWTAATTSPFVTITPASGDGGTTKVELTVTPNTSVNQRSAEVKFFTLAGGQIGKTVYLYQFGAQATVTPSSLTFRSGGETLSVNVDSDVEVAPIETPEWISISPATLPVGTSELTLTASPNPYLAERASQVTLYPSTGVRTPLQTITVTQLPVTGGVEANVYAGLSALGDKVTVNFTCDGSWKASTTSAFVTISPYEGQGGSAPVEIILAPNTSTDSRSAEVRFYSLAGGQIGKTVYLYQVGAKTSVVPTSLNFGNEEETLTALVESDVEITSISAPDWITATPETLPVGSSEIAITAAKNRTTSERSGDVNLLSADGTTRATIPVVQQPSGMTDDTDFLLTWKAQAFAIPLNVTDNWTAVVSSTGWIKLEAYSGTPSKPLTVIVEENNTEYVRGGSIRIIAGSTQTDVRITQQGQYIHVDGSEATLPLDASTLKVSVSSSMGSAIEEILFNENSTGWLTLTDQTTEGEVTEYTFIASENHNAFTRDARVVFAPADKTGSGEYTGLIYTVYQKGREISLTESVVYSSGSGGNSETITVTADGKYTLTKADNAEWFLINRLGNSNTFSIYFGRNNTGSSREGAVIASLSGLPADQEKSVTLKIVQSDVDMDISVEPFQLNIDY